MLFKKNRILSRPLLTLVMVLSFFTSFGQEDAKPKPKLVVGIVVDQMKFEFLYKYEQKFTDGGFKRLMKEGFNFKNAHINYIPTVTAAGHASIFSGTTPSTHGIIGNSWYQRNLKYVIENIGDDSEIIIGSEIENKRGASPRNMLTTTISDELRLASNFKSKVVGISLKDRGAILSAGHSANAAYWHDWVTSPGHFVSSSYYMDHLPDWVVAFNEKGKSNEYLNTSWTTLFPVETYTESAADNNTHEPKLGGKRTPTFPYDFALMREKFKKIDAEYQLIWVSPAGNSLLTDFALEVIKNEELGEDETTDMLTISYSSTDVVGHTFGIQSVELEDLYLRLDLEIQRLLNYLDNNIGRNQYVLFLTSDHGASHAPSYLKRYKLPTGVARIGQYKDTLNHFLTSKYGKSSWIEHFETEHLYLNRESILKKKLDLNTVHKDVVSFLSTLDGITSASSGTELQTQNYSNGLKELVQNGYHPQRSGDVILTFNPGTVLHANSAINVAATKGAVHSTGFSYDTHVPLLFFGSNITSGASYRKVAPIDIPASLAYLLQLPLPSGSSGEPLVEILK